MLAVVQADARDRLDGFVLGERLHRGAMSTIYRIAGVEGRAPLAFAAIMKLPRTGAGEGGESMLGFETEARILPALSGLHVPRVVAAGDIARTPYLVVEWVEGESLEQLLRAGPMPDDRVAALGAVVADAVQDIHDQGTIHFDLKPENVIIRPTGEAVLIDFGMAHHVRFTDLLAEQRRFASGSAPYISPEQVLGNRRDPRSDLYALGAMLYEMSAGELPFGAPRTLAGLRDRLWLDPAPPRSIAPHLAPWLQEVILRCLEPQPDKRYGSARELAAALRNPGRVELTARGRKRKRAGLVAQARRWWRANSQPPAVPATASQVPVVMVAVDTMHPDDERHPALKQAAARALSLRPQCRFICVSVVRGEAVAASADQPGIHLEHLRRLRQWVEGLGVPENRLSLHVIQSLSPSSALVQFARDNAVELIVIGAPDPSHQAFAWWRSVASKVTANAHCTVHVIRAPHGDRNR